MHINSALKRDASNVTFKVRPVDCFLFSPWPLQPCWQSLQIYTQRVGEELFPLSLKNKMQINHSSQTRGTKKRKKESKHLKTSYYKWTQEETANRLFVPTKPAAAAASSFQGGFPKTSEVFWGFPCGVKSCWLRSRYEVCSVALLLRESDEVFLNMCISPGMNPFSFVKWTASWESRPP